MVNTVTLGAASQINSGASTTPIPIGKTGVEGVIFSARLDTPSPASTASLNTDTPESSQYTLVYTRLFEHTVLNSTGSYTSFGSGIPALAFNSVTGSYMLAGVGGNTVSAVGSPSNRDVTQAGWVKTTLTPAFNAVGIDDVVSSASTLTATADLGQVLFPITAAAASRVGQAFIKRSAGRGRVWFTLDGGTSWTDVTSFVGSSYKKINTTSGVINPSIGFMLEYSGDAIIVDAISVTTTGFPSATDPIINGANQIQQQSLGWQGARPASSSSSFSVSATIYIEPGFVQGGNVAISNASGLGRFIINWGASNNNLNLQMSNTSTGTFFINPPLGLQWRDSGVGIPVGIPTDIKMVWSGATAYAYINERLSAIYQGATGANNDITTLNNIGLTLTNGNRLSNLRICEWSGKTITLFGDSFSSTEAFRQNILKQTPKECVVVQAASGGSTTTTLIARLAADLQYAVAATTADTWLILWIGSNDFAANATVSATFANMQTIVNGILAINPATKIVCVTVPQYRTVGLAGITEAEFTARVLSFNSQLPSLVGIYAAVEINNAATALASFYSDGLHPKYKYNPEITRKIIAVMK